MTSALSIEAWPGVAPSGWANSQPAEWQQPPTGWQQNTGVVQESTVWKQPVIISKPTGWHQPQVVQQSTGWQKPATGWQQPQVVQQPTGWQQPQVEQQLTGGPNPAGWQRPNAGWQQTPAVWEQNEGGQQQSEWDAGNYPARKPTITKHIYVHVPQPEKEEVLPARWIQPSPPNKHYKIIFIKTPEGPKLGPIKIPAQPQNEEKTLVYVLSKKPDTQQEIIVQPQLETKPSKPEVFFIKYKTKTEQTKYGPPEITPSPPKTEYGVPSH